MSYLFSLLFLLWSLLFPFSLAYADGQPVINEFFPHPSSGNKEWVELYVPDGVDVTNYWIDDDADFTSDTGSSAKKQITSLIQGSDSHHIVFELSSSMFNNDGDTVALFSPDGSLVDQYTYTSDPGEDVSIGRTPDVTGSFQLLASATKGSPNSDAQPASTPTPAPTDKPTPTSKPTITPKPPATPTSVKTKSTWSSSTPTIGSNIALADEVKVPINNTKSLSSIKTSSNEAYPTSVLGISTKSAGIRPTLGSSKKVVVEDDSNSTPNVIVFCLGGVLFCVCGILIFLKKKGKLPF